MSGDHPKYRRLPEDGPQLAAIHRRSNYRKMLGYWIGFLRGVLASSALERGEMAPVRVEAEHLLAMLGDDDAAEVLRDLDMFADEPHEIFAAIETIVEVRANELVDPTETDEINEFYGFCAGIACDNALKVGEIEKLINRIDGSKALSSDTRIKSLKASALASIADGLISPIEEIEVCEWISRLVGDTASDTGLPTYGNVGLIEGAIAEAEKILFADATFVLTGKFMLGSKSAIGKMIVDQGGFWKDAICAKCDYLVVAATASRDWKYSHEGNKIRRALELRSERGRPQIVHEHALARALGH